MTEKIRVRASTLSTAQPYEIFPLLVNSATYPLWSTIRYYESLRTGRDGLHDIGALRLFRTNRFAVMREEITDITPNERVGYTLLSGFPLLEYHARTTLEKIASGTRITWESSFFPKYPITGFFWRALMRWVLKSMVRSLAKAAEDPELRSKMLALAQGRTMAKKAMVRFS